MFIPVILLLQIYVLYIISITERTLYICMKHNRERAASFHDLYASQKSSWRLGGRRKMYRR